MLPVSICLDFGNTNLKAAIFMGDKLIDKVLFKPEQAIDSLKEIIQFHNPSRSILSSVVDYNKDIEDFLKLHTQFYLLTTHTKVPFLNAYGSPETLGNDRIALVAGLCKHFPLTDSLVISVGTCITYNFLAKNNAFRGGAISPGIELRFKALNQFTQKLPQVNREGHISILGYDTETSIRSGVINGMAAEMDGMIDRYEAQYGKINAVLTGGDAPFFESRLKNKIFADTNFLFKGLYAVLDQLP
jgi:type III pantothenate kinase